MIRIDNIKLPLDALESEIPKKAAVLLGINAGEVIDFEITKKTVDARKKNDIHIVYGVHLTVKKRSPNHETHQ